MANKKIALSFSDRVFITGGTGSGKTTLVKALLWEVAKRISKFMNENPDLPVPAIYILDSKISGDFAEFYQKGYGVLYQGNAVPPLHDVRKYGYFQVWQPEDDDRSEGGHYDQWLEQIYKNRQPCIVYIDEFSSISGRTGWAVPYYGKLQKQGRGLGIGVWTTNQKVTYVDPNIISETTHIFKLRLNGSTDTKKLVDQLGAHAAKHQPEDEYGFYYRDCRKPIQSNAPVYYSSIYELLENEEGE